MSELRAAAERVRLDGEPGERWTATVAGLAVVIVLSLIDALWVKNFPSAVVIGPFLTALLANERQTLGVGLAAIASVLLSASWNNTTIGADYWVRAGVVVAGVAIAVVAAHRRERVSRAEAIGAQLTAALSNLAEAVVVQDDELQMLYANDAAAETLGYASAETLLTTSRDQLVSVAEYFAEDGSPMSESEYPSTRALRGEDAGRVAIQIINRWSRDEYDKTG